MYLYTYVEVGGGTWCEVTSIIDKKKKITDIIHVYEFDCIRKYQGRMYIMAIWHHITYKFNIFSYFFLYFIWKM